MDPYAPLRMSMLKTADVLLLPIGDVLGTYYSPQQKLFEYMAASRPLAMVATPARLSVIDDKGAYIAWNREPSDFAAVIVEASTDRAGAPAGGCLCEEVGGTEVRLAMAGPSVRRANQATLGELGPAS
jgi:hypothetical protein